MCNNIITERLIREETVEEVCAEREVSCLSVSARNDGGDGNDIYHVVFKLTHTGHQSYGQTIRAVMSTSVTVAEAPGDTTVTADGNVLTIVRDNQLNDTGLTEIWIKLRASSEPRVVSAVAVNCVC